MVQSLYAYDFTIQSATWPGGVIIFGVYTVAHTQLFIKSWYHINPSSINQGSLYYVNVIMSGIISQGTD